MKTYLTVILCVITACCVLLGCEKAALAPVEETTLITETVAQTDAVIEEKQEDADSVVTGEVDISQLEEPTTLPTEATTETTAPPTTTIPTEPTVETQEPSESQTAPGRESDGYFDYVIKP